MTNIVPFRRREPAPTAADPLDFWFEALTPLPADRRRNLILLAYRTGVASFDDAKTMLNAWPDDGLDGRDVAALQADLGSAG